MWDLTGPGIEPVSPALAGGFLTTASPGKPSMYFYFILFFLTSFLCIFKWLLSTALFTNLGLRLICIINPHPALPRGMGMARGQGQIAGPPVFQIGVSCVQ